MHRVARRGLLTCGLVFAMALVRAGEYDVVIHEISYNPISQDDSDQFLELHNRGGTQVDLSGWYIGEGLTFVFPPGATIAAKGFLVLTPDAVTAPQRLGTDLVLGDWMGQLDNGGEVVSLHNAEGATISRVHYLDGGAWPSSADGLGPTLELIDPYAQIDVPSNWRPSRTVGGTPGAPNSRGVAQVAPGTETVLIESDEVWRYRKGTSAYPAGWREAGFNDSGWSSGATGIGYDDEDDATVLDDMQGGYLSFAARKTFDLDAAQLDELGEVVLTVDYDDAFVAWINGVEVARSNLASAGAEVPHDAEADDSHEAGSPESFRVITSVFVEGVNVLAVQVHNQDIDSSDASFIPRLFSLPAGFLGPGAESGPSVVINELAPSADGAPGFLELYNATEETLDVTGWRLRTTSGGEHVLGPRTLAAGELLALDGATLGFDTPLATVRYWLEDDSGSWMDGVNPSPGPATEPNASYGRWPDGDDDHFAMVTPTPGAPNEVELSSAVVIHEIQFHPPYVAPGPDCERDCSDSLQWIELHNRSAAPVSLDGWDITKGIRFAFPAGTTIAAGGYLVVASSRDTLLAARPGLDPARVVGDWSRNLSHDSDTINLRDQRGNLVDHVRYGDGQPRNDEEPQDEISDRTIRVSEWIDGADGTGNTLELIHPALDNRLGASWAIGPVGGTPGTANASYDPTPDPVVGDVRHSPAVPTTGEEVFVRCRVSGVTAPAMADVVWRVEGTALGGRVALRDDGLSGDRMAGDGVWGAHLPARPSGDTVSFRIEVRRSGGSVVGYPPPPDVEPYTGFEGPYYVYQVIDEQPPVNPSPTYWVFMTDADADELSSRDLYSDVLLPATFVARLPDGREIVRHLVGIRYRGSATRDETPRSYRVEFPPERDFDDATKINLNAQQIERELLASDFFTRSGVPAPLDRTIDLFFRGGLNPRYVHKERVDSEFLARWFGDASDDGNLYRAFDPSGFPDEGDLRYLGEDPDAYRPYYGKRSNREEDDYSDIIELCRAFDPVETPDSEFADRVDGLIDAWQWARFFAAQACLTNDDGGIHSSSGEDYLLYRVPAESRRIEAGKWILIPWDIEETYSDRTERLFRPSIAAIRRFLTHPRFAPLYYCNLMELRFGTFSRAQSRQRFRLINFLFGFSTIDGLDSFVTARIGFLDENVPMRLSTGASSSGNELIPDGATWRYFKGLSEPSGGGLGWTTLAFDDSTWPTGPAGFGYGDSDDRTTLDDMEDGYTTVYIRRRFDVADPALLGGLELVIDYDDGFVAFLNGVEVARREAGTPGAPIAFDDTASGDHEAGTPESIDLSAFVEELVPGENVLALVGLNGAIGSSDLSLAPILTRGPDAGGDLGCGDLVYTTSDTVGLGGFSNACETSRVLVDGNEASYDPVEGRWSGVASVAPGEQVVTVRALDVFGLEIESLDVVVRRVSEPGTTVGGTISSSTTWRAEDSPFLLTSTVTVAPGATLTIEPGVALFGSAGASILVEGRLVAVGTEADPIRFRSSSCAQRWGGIAIEGTGVGPGDPTHRVAWCDFEFGDTAPGYAGHLSPVDAKLLVEDCSFRLLTANAVDGTDARVEVRRSRFDTIHEGVHCTSSTVIVVDCMFSNMVGDKDAIDFDLNGSERSLIEGCIFVNGSDDGIDLGDTTVDIRDNVFINIQDKALSLEDNGPLGPPTISGNIIFACGTGIALKSGVTVDVAHHNTVVGNQEGISLYAKDNAPDGGHGVFHSTIVWNNTFDVLLDSKSTVSFSHSDISLGVWPGEGNISLDPRFADVLAYDFSLLPGSPCIGTGLDGSEMGAVPFVGNFGVFVRGDVDADGTIGLADVLQTLGHLFQGGGAPECLDRIDANDDGRNDVSDAVYSLRYLFAGGGAPPAPFPAEGTDPTPDPLSCP